MYIIHIKYNICKLYDIIYIYIYIYDTIIVLHYFSDPYDNKIDHYPFVIVSEVHVKQNGVL